MERLRHARSRSHSPNTRLPGGRPARRQPSPEGGLQSPAPPHTPRGSPVSLPFTALAGPACGCAAMQLSGGSKGLVLSPGGSRGASHAWSHRPVGAAMARRWLRGDAGRPSGLWGGRDSSSIHLRRRVHPTSEAAFPAPCPFLSCPDTPETKASLLLPPLPLSCSAETLWFPPRHTDTHTPTLALPSPGQPIRSCSPYFMPFKPRSRSLLSWLRMTHFLPFPPYSAPASVPTSRPLRLPSGRPAREPPRAALLRCSLRAAGLGGGRGTGALSAPCLFSFPPRTLD